MKIFIKISVIFLTIFTIFSSSSSAADRILPIPKPTVDEEVKKITAKKKEIYPQKKPEFKVKVSDSEKNLDEITEINQSITIYPQKKPIFVQKKSDKAVSKSSILTKKDFDIAKSVFEEIENKKWKTALKLSKKARDKSIYKLINYLDAISGRIVTISGKLISKITSMI